MSYLDYIEVLMCGGMDEETACRMADMEFNPEYSADDYDE